MNKYDAILVPGGGVTQKGELKPYVAARFDRALELADSEPSTNAPYIVALSAGTNRKTHPLNQHKFPIYESVAGIKYLRNKGYPRNKILYETCSFDTQGNAYFARTIHTDVLGLSKLAVVTSEFHLPRTKAIFDLVFRLEPVTAPYTLKYFDVSNSEIKADALELRVEEEKRKTAAFIEDFAKLRKLSEFHVHLFTNHGCYDAGRNAFTPNEETNATSATY